MSGTYLLVQPLPYSVHEEGYRQAMKALGLENATPEERIKALLETPPQDLISKIPPSVPVAPAVDGDLIPSALTYAQTADKTEKTLKAKAWCKDLLIGDAQIDVSVLKNSLSIVLLLTMLALSKRQASYRFSCPI